MKTNETKNLENLKELTAQYFTTLKPTNEANFYTVQIKVLNYFELGSVITNMLKLCILALEQDAHKNSEKNQSIEVRLILETVLSIFPLDEFEFLSEVSEIIGE